MFKKALGLIVLSSLMLSLSVVSIKAVTSMGYIDVQKVFTSYKATQSAQKELSKEEEAFKKEFEKSQKEIEKAQKDGKSKDEIEKLTKNLEKKLSPKRERLLKLNEKLTLDLQAKIVEAVKGVAKDLGIEVVVDKQVIITGGINITDLVINRLNRKKK